MKLKTWSKREGEREREREAFCAKPERGSWALKMLRFYYIAAKFSFY